MATRLAPTAYERVAEGFGALGLSVDDEAALPGVLRQAREAAAEGRPVLVNVHVGRTGFRDGSLSV